MNFHKSYFENKSKYNKFINLNPSGGTNGEISDLSMESIFNDIHLVHAVRDFDPISYRFTISKNKFQIDELVKGSTEYEFGAQVMSINTSKIKTKEITDYHEPLTDKLMEELIEYKSSYRGYVHCSWGTLVHGHFHGGWEMPPIIISARLALQKGRIMVAAPLDTMILDYLTYDDKSFLLCEIQTLKKLVDNNILSVTKPIAKIFLKEKLYYEEIENNNTSKEDGFYHGLVNGLHLYTYNKSDKPDLRDFISKIILSRYKINISNYKTRYGFELNQELNNSDIKRRLNLMFDNPSNSGEYNVVKKKLIGDDFITLIYTPTMYIQDVITYDKLQEYLKLIDFEIACKEKLFQDIKIEDIYNFFAYIRKLYNMPKSDMIEQINKTKLLFKQFGEVQGIQESKTDVTGIIEKLKENLNMLYDERKFIYLKEWSKIIHYITKKENEKTEKFIIDDFIKKTNSFESEHCIHYTIDGMLINEYNKEESKTNKIEPYVFVNKIYDSYKINPFKFLNYHFICANKNNNSDINDIHLLQGLFTYNCDNGLENINILFNKLALTHNEHDYIFTHDDDQLHMVPPNYYPSLLGLYYHDYIFNTTIQNTNQIEYLNQTIKDNLLILWNYIKKVYFFIFICRAAFQRKHKIRNTLVNALLLNKNKIIMKFLLLLDVSMFLEIEVFYKTRTKSDPINFTDDNVAKLKKMYMTLINKINQSKELITSLSELYEQILHKQQVTY